MVTPAARRQAVAHLCVEFEVSQRRACEVIGADRTSVRYLSRRPDDAPFERGCVSWPSYAGASAIAVCFS